MRELGVQIVYRLLRARHTVNRVQHRRFALGLSVLLAVLALSDRASAQGSPRRDPAVQWWVAINGGYGRIDAYHTDYEDAFYQGTLSSASYGARLGWGGFSGRRLQLGGEISFFGAQALRRTRVVDEDPSLQDKDTKAVGFIALMPMGLVFTAYAFDRHGPFLSGAARVGCGLRWADHPIFAGTYSGEVGYAFLDLLSRGRTSVAMGYESSGTMQLFPFALTDYSEKYDGHHVTLSLRAEL